MKMGVAGIRNNIWGFEYKVPCTKYQVLRQRFDLFFTNRCSVLGV